MRRSLSELFSVDEPAWPNVMSWIAEAINTVEVLPPNDESRGDALVAVQVSTRSPMGAVIYESGGLLIDHGWLRVLGSGHPRLTRSVPEWNRGRTWLDPNTPPPLLLIADDVVGGFFAINGGALQSAPGSVNYFAPDTLEWESLDMGYSEFLYWSLTGPLDQFYADTRWNGWEHEVRGMSGDRAFSIYPFPFAKGPPIGERSRRPVPIEELFDLYVSGARR